MFPRDPGPAQRDHRQRGARAAVGTGNRHGGQRSESVDDTIVAHRIEIEARNFARRRVSQVYDDLKSSPVKQLDPLALHRSPHARRL